MFRVFKIFLLSALVSTLLIGCKTADLEKRIAALEGKNTELSERLDEIKELADELDSIKGRVGHLEARPSPQPLPRAGQEYAYNLPVGKSFILGKKSAPVNVVIFSDYQCPFCAKADTLMREVATDPELKDHVNIVFKHFPLSFHQHAKSAAKAALAAGEQGNNTYWEMSRLIFENQSDLGDESYEKFAKEIGLDVAKFHRDLKNNDAKYEAIFKNDTKLGLEKANVRGTPSIFVNGWELKERSIDGIKTLITDKKLKKHAS